ALRLLRGGPDLEALLLALGAVAHADPDALGLHPVEHALPVLRGEVEPAQADVDHVDAVVALRDRAVLAGGGGEALLGPVLAGRGRDEGGERRAAARRDERRAKDVSVPGQAIDFADNGRP